MRRGPRRSTLLPTDGAVYPGGSGMPVDFGFIIAGVLRSMTHCGGGGGGLRPCEDILKKLIWCGM